MTFLSYSGDGRSFLGEAETALRKKRSGDAEKEDDEARSVASNIAKMPMLLKPKDAQLHYAEEAQGDSSHYDDDWNHHVPPARLWHTGAFRSPVQLVRVRHQPVSRFLRHA